MMELCFLAKEGFGSMADLLTLDSDAVLDSLEYACMMRELEEDAINGSRQ